LTNYARDIGINTSKLELAFAKADQQAQMAQQTQQAGKVPNVTITTNRENHLEAKMQ